MLDPNERENLTLAVAVLALAALIGIATFSFLDYRASLQSSTEESMNVQPTEQGR
jgi:hypothetical protein